MATVEQAKATFQEVIEKTSERINKLEETGKRADVRRALVGFVEFCSSLNDEQKYLLQYLVKDAYLSDAEEIIEVIKDLKLTLKKRGL